MHISKEKDLKLKLGNLMLALIFSVVPTTMTIAFLAVHGFILCRNLDNYLENTAKLEVSELCEKSNIDANYDYLVWIWLITTIPTWRWFYIGHYRRLKKQ